MATIKKIYWYLLIFGIAIYIISNLMLQSQVNMKLKSIERQLESLSGETE